MGNPVIPIRIGAGFQAPMTIRSQVGGDPFSLTGRTTTVVFFAPKQPDIEATVVVLDATAGQIRIDLTKAQTALLQPGRVNHMMLTSELTAGDDFPLISPKFDVEGIE